MSFGPVRSWKVPASDAAGHKVVTLRMLLSHTAGINVPGFAGYSAGRKVPTTRQVLDGVLPANTPPIRVVSEPGVKCEYSGGGYTIVQKLIEDENGQAFPAAMRELVLDRIPMKSSTFEQRLPDARSRGAASGHGADGAPIPGRWNA
jgi:CubicO group peptidase (beta-lactamase class C family)